MSIRKALEADRAGEPVRVYHINGGARRDASRVWTHQLDEWCVACESGGRILPHHVKRGDVSPRPDDVTRDKAKLAARGARRRRGRGGAREALAALNDRKEQ